MPCRGLEQTLYKDCWADWLLALRLHVGANNHRAMYKSEMRCLGCTAQTLVETLPHGASGDGQPPKSNGTETAELNLESLLFFRKSPKVCTRLLEQMITCVSLASVRKLCPTRRSTISYSGYYPEHAARATWEKPKKR